MAACVVSVAAQGMVPLVPFGQNPVGIDTAGRFTVKFDIASWGHDRSAAGIPIRKAMIERVSKIIASKGKWHSGSPTNLSFKSATAYPLLNGPNKQPSKEFLEFLGLSTMPIDPVVQATLASLEASL